MKTGEGATAARRLRSKGLALLGGLLVGGVGAILIAWLTGSSGGVPVAVFNLSILASISAVCLVWLLLARKRAGAKTVTHRQIFGLSVVVGSLLVTVAFLVFIFVFTFDTEYAPGYSETAFRSVRIGDSREEVLQVLGQPLRVYGSEGEVEVLSYSRSPSGSNYLMRDIVLDSEGRVVEIRRQIWWALRTFSLHAWVIVRSARTETVPSSPSRPAQEQI